MNSLLEHTAKKHWGQHFLVQPGIAHRISRLLRPDFKTLIEIGPGTGALTRWLMMYYSERLQAVEIDPRLSTHLSTQYPSLLGKIHTENFIDFSLSGFLNPIALIGNLPYNLSSQILFKALKNKDIINQAVFLIQKEVAERIGSKPFSKSYGILSVLVQFFFDVKVEFEVQKVNFVPVPKVTSSVLTLRRNDNTLLESVEDKLFLIVKCAFNQRRKMLRNSLKALLPYIDTESWFVPFADKRPEQLQVKDFVVLATHLSKASEMAYKV